MSQAWLPSAPRTPNTAIVTPPKPLLATAGVLHRTYGRWAGDLATLQVRRVPSVHFLVGKQDPHWCQMVPATVTANHAAGANTWAIGVEFEGRNEEPLTAWQVARGADILRWAKDTLAIPIRLYTDPARTSAWHGWLNHANVATAPGYRHSDAVTLSDFLLIAAAATGTAAPTAPKVAPMYSPPHQLEPIVADLACPTGGAWLLAASGAVYAYGGAPYFGGTNSRPWFAGRQAARLELPTANEAAAGKRYVVIATSGERYALPA